MLRRSFLKTAALALGFAAVGAHKVLGEVVPIPAPPPALETRFLCEIEEGRNIAGIRTVTKYLYAATEREIRALGFGPEDFPDTVLEFNEYRVVADKDAYTPRRELQFRNALSDPLGVAPATLGDWHSYGDTDLDVEYQEEK